VLSVSRRQVIRGLAAGVVCMAGGARAALVPTPDEGPGPFYPETIPLDHDADLVQVAGRAGMAQGEIVNLFGRVLTLSGEPVPGALVEIWQCDYRGCYKHATEWRGAADPNFQGYGTTKSTGSGSYRFRTIKPVRYTGRTPHIHAMISGPGIKRFTTQIYLKGHPQNAEDYLFKGLGDQAKQDAASVLFRPRSGDGAADGRFDFVIG
jgi:protocatechuate 3,4-dioxygenase beta subunit